MKKTNVFVVAALVVAVGFVATSCVTINEPAQQPSGQEPSAQPLGQGGVQPPVGQPGSSQILAHSERDIRGSGIPEIVRNAIRNAPEDSLVAIGVSSHSNINLARQAALGRARADLTAQLGIFVRYMFGDFVAGSEAERQALIQYTEAITHQLAQAELRGASSVDEDMIGGNYWVVMMLNRNHVNDNVMGGHEATVALSPHFAQYAFALDRMGEAFREQGMNNGFIGNNQRPLEVRDSD
jgi:hypothetical protein